MLPSSLNFVPERQHEEWVTTAIALPVPTPDRFCNLTIWQPECPNQILSSNKFWQIDPACQVRLGRIWCFGTPVPSLEASEWASWICIRNACPNPRIGPEGPESTAFPNRPNRHSHRIMVAAELAELHCCPNRKLPAPECQNQK